jgi:hypothetical protein
MPIFEDLKEYAERGSGLRRPGKRLVPDLVRERKPRAVRFKDDGLIPNHPRWPFIIYRAAVSLGNDHDPAAVMEVPMAGPIRGAMASTTTCITIPVFTRCSESHEAERAFVSAAARAGSTRSRPATSSCCRPARASVSIRRRRLPGRGRLSADGHL